MLNDWSDRIPDPPRKSPPAWWWILVASFTGMLIVSIYRSYSHLTYGCSPFTTSTASRNRPSDRRESQPRFRWRRNRQRRPIPRASPYTSAAAPERPFPALR